MSEEAYVSQIVVEIAHALESRAFISQVVIEIAFKVGLTLTWQDNSENADSLHLERKTDAGEYVEIQQLSPGTEYYVDPTAETGHAYRYRIRAYDDELGYGHYSNIAEIVV